MSKLINVRFGKILIKPSSPHRCARNCVFYRMSKGIIKCHAKSRKGVVTNGDRTVYCINAEMENYL